MEIIRWIKDHLLVIVGGLAVVGAGLFLRDANTQEVIKSFIRRQLVEDEVNKLKETLAKGNADIAANDETLLKAAEAMKQAKINAKTASDQEVIDFYKKHLGQ